MSSANKAHILEPKAFALYKSGKYTQAEIAERIGVSEQTISIWKKKYEWDARLEKLSASTRRSVETLRSIIAKKIDKLRDLEEDDIPKGIGDELHKLQLVLDRIDGQFDRLAFTLEVMEDLNEFLLGNYPDLAQEFHEVLSPFLNYIGNKYGQ